MRNLFGGVKTQEFGETFPLDTIEEQKYFIQTYAIKYYYSFNDSQRSIVNNLLEKVSKTEYLRRLVSISVLAAGFWLIQDYFQGQTEPVLYWLMTSVLVLTTFYLIKFERQNRADILRKEAIEMGAKDFNITQ